MADLLAAAQGCCCGRKGAAAAAAAAAAGPSPMMLRWRAWQRPGRTHRLSGDDRNFLRWCLGGWPSLAGVTTFPGFCFPSPYDIFDELDAELNDRSSNDTDEESSSYRISVGPADASGSAHTHEPLTVEQEDGVQIDNDALCRKIHFVLACDSEDEVDGQTTMTPNSCGSYEAMFDSRWDLQHSGWGVADVTDDLDDSSSEVDEWRYDIEDEFAFDEDRVAEAVRRGANAQELDEVIQEAMAGALEARMTGNLPVPQDTRPAAVTGGNRLMVPGAEPHTDASEGSTTCRVTGDLGGLMTPTAPSGSETPSADDATSPGAAALDEEELQLRLQKAAATKTRRKPSFVPRLSKLPQLADAVRVETARHRRSFAQVAALVENADLGEKPTRNVRRSLTSAREVRRQSLLKAAAVIETATVGDEAEASSPTSTQEVDKQLRLVHRAMLSAREKHRLSIVTAVDMAAQGHSRPETEEIASSEKTCHSGPLPSQGMAHDKVLQVVAAAYTRHKALGPKAGAPPAWTALMHMQKVEGRQPRVHCGPRREPCKDPLPSSRGGTCSKQGGRAATAAFGGS